MIDIVGQILWWSGFMIVPLAPIVTFVLLSNRAWYARVVVAIFVFGLAVAFLPMMGWSIVFRDGMKPGMVVSTGWEAWENAFPGIYYRAKWGIACAIGILLTLILSKGESRHPSASAERNSEKNA